MKTNGFIDNFIGLFQQVKLKKGLKYWSVISLGLFSLSSTYADQQPFNLQIHLKTTNLQPVPPVEAATWCNTIKNNLPTDAIPANPGQPIIQCRPEEGGLLVNLNLQYTPPPPPPDINTYVKVRNQFVGDARITGTKPDGTSYNSGYYSWNNSIEAHLLAGSRITFKVKSGPSYHLTVPSPNHSGFGQQTVTCSGTLIGDLKCGKWSPG